MDAARTIEGSLAGTTWTSEYEEGYVGNVSRRTREFGTAVKLESNSKVMLPSRGEDNGNQRTRSSVCAEHCLWERVQDGVLKLVLV